MTNKKGGIVAIDPSTGEILALVSSPTYDPNLFVGRDFSKNYTILSNDTVGIPLFARAFQAYYPPGSTFKLMDALIGQQEGVLTPQTLYPCHAGFTLNKGVPGCHVHASPLNLDGAISQSCNSYFSWVFKTIMDNNKFHGNTQAAFENWRKYISSFGVGQKLGTDVPFDSKGNVPTVETYNAIYGKGWHTMNVISLGIGQAELGLTPLQMCNVVCSIANRGYYYTPHVIRKVGDNNPLEKWKLKHYTLVTDQSAYESVISGMANVLVSGTARASAIPGIEMCGKTGTAQNPHGDNHSVFVCFAPRINPKICVAVLVENAGQGAWWAAPIASLMVEQYLKGNIPEPERQVILKRMENGDLIHMDPKIKKTNPAYWQ
ncbi:MAG TPA: penicillin-binding transpeptidase domain-containing protein [Bacteroidia bacterium]|nr:penicillin-binding transpeptidase domain-containing protein [Bacteroidia bacterium]